MNVIGKTRRAAKVSKRRLLHRAASTVAVLAVVATAVGLPVIAPETADRASSVVAIARADCPPDCGGNPGGGNSSGPPGGGTEFVAPSMPAMPSYEPGRGYPAPDQNSGVSIYNSATPQPGQAAQPNQAPAQNQDGGHNRAANGEQQPVQYSHAPVDQQVNPQWRELSNHLSRGADDNPPQAINNNLLDQSPRENKLGNSKEPQIDARRQGAEGDCGNMASLISAAQAARVAMKQFNKTNGTVSTPALIAESDKLFKAQTDTAEVIRNSMECAYGITFQQMTIRLWGDAGGKPGPILAKSIREFTAQLTREDVEDRGFNYEMIRAMWYAYSARNPKNNPAWEARVDSLEKILELFGGSVDHS